VAAGYGERLAAEGEICWGGMHSWRKIVELLELVDRPKIIGFQADMAHTLLYVLGYNAPEDALLPPDWNWSDPARLDDALYTLTRALRPWTIDFHVAQNDATVKGSGTHDKTGHHCLPTDPNGKLQIGRHAGYWMRNESGKLVKAFRHICWDGCMFANEIMMQPQTWNDILSAMIAVRDAHGWSEIGAVEEIPTAQPVEVESAPKAVARKPVKRAPAKAPKKAAKRPAKRAVAPKGGKKAKVPAKKVPAKKAPARKPVRAKAVRKAPRAKTSRAKMKKARRR
jgi:hypothetical protein